jgi:hypothetical protein
VRPRRTVLYKVHVRPATKHAITRKAAGLILNLRVVLPAGVHYVKSKTVPQLYASNSSGRKAKSKPVLSDGSMVLTWEDIGAKRSFEVKTRVDNAVARGTQLTFSAQLFESVQVGPEASPACPRSAPNVTVTVV